MKCTNCGKNNAMYHYHFEMNGETQEAHLCEECANKLQPEREFASRTQEMFGDMFPGGLLGGSLFDRQPKRGLLDGFFGRDPFEGFFGGSLMSPFAMLGMPRIEITFPEAESRTAERTESRETGGVDPELARRRRLNALREQMRAAAQAEDYEKAAQLRDQLKALEKEDDKE